MRALGLVMVVVAVVLSGCDEPRCEAAYEGDAAIKPPDGSPRAIRLLELTLAREFGATREVAVRWSEGRLAANGFDVDGLQTSCMDIWVQIRPGDRLSETALAHEMVHCYTRPADQCGIAPDTDHSEPWLWSRGGLVDYLNVEVLAAAGL